MANQEPYTYESAGFTPFFNRRLGSINAPTLGRISSQTGTKEMNFDHSQTSGSLGDKIAVGKGLVLDGPNHRVVILDEGGIEVGWIGNITGS